jgi:hypothetical protein
MARARAPRQPGAPGAAPAVFQQDDRARQMRNRREQLRERRRGSQPFLPWFATARSAAATASGSPR